MSEPTSVTPVQSGRGLAQLNPAPEQVQRFSLRVVGAPGPFAEVQATAQYDVSNEAECGHINPASGTAERITSQETLSLQPAADGSWHGEVALDLLQDQDYYGRGVCRWALTATLVASSCGPPAPMARPALSPRCRCRRSRPAAR